MMDGTIVCVDYADYLAESLPLNLKHFRRLVIVTTPEDVETQRIARYYGVQHVQTDVIRSRWGEFHKARGINKGLDALSNAEGKPDGWVLHLDADMVLPPQTDALIERANLDPALLYGCDRYVVPGFEAWRLHQAMPPLQQDNYHVHLDIFPLAPRFSGVKMGGYAPPGFFQLWNPRQSGVLRYPTDHSSAAKTDVLHTARWWRNGRALIPEFVAYHLESESAAQGTNWGGRQTARWGPEPDRHHHHSPHRHRPPPHHHHHEHHHHPRPWPYDPPCDE